MYNHLLDTFIEVIDSGSFNKASKKLFISPTSIMKQINLLENQLSLTLILRNRNGLKVTPEGKFIYDKAKKIIEFSNNTLLEAKNLDLRKTIRIGSSFLNPAKKFINIWNNPNNKYKDFSLSLIPFNDDHVNILSEIQQLGNKFDFLIGVCNSNEWMNFCNFLPIMEYKIMIAVSKNHRLANKKIVNLKDLEKETIMMVKKGDSNLIDSIRSLVNNSYPNIKIEDLPFFYDLSVFNRCADTNNVLLNVECWNDIHPNLVTIPVNWSYTIPYGILYSKDPSKEIVEIIENLKSII